MEFKLYDKVILKKDYTQENDNKVDTYKTGWIGVIILLNEEKHGALVEFNENKYNISYGILNVSLDDLEQYYEQ